MAAFRPAFKTLHYFRGILNLFAEAIRQQQAQVAFQHGVGIIAPRQLIIVLALDASLFGMSKKIAGVIQGFIADEPIEFNYLKPLGFDIRFIN
jgi:hypothetical protein